MSGEKTRKNLILYGRIEIKGEKYRYVLLKLFKGFFIKGLSKVISCQINGGRFLTGKWRFLLWIICPEYL
jgi:hypothetical protein